MTIKVGAAGGGQSPLPRFPDSVLGPDGELATDGNIIPHNGTLVNQIEMPTAYSTTSTGDYQGFLSGSLVWSVNATDVNAACDGWMGIVSHIYDSTNDRLYVFAVDAGTSPYTLYTAYITLETGAVTNVGNHQLAANPTNYNAIGGAAPNRPNIASGNFTLLFEDRTVVVDETDGSRVSDTASTNITGTNSPGTYTTADGTTSIWQSTFGDTGQSVITKSGVSTRISTVFKYDFGNKGLTSGVYFVNWGDKVKAYSPGGVDVPIIRTFLKTDFDDWLSDMADYAGI